MQFLHAEESKQSSGLAFSGRNPDEFPRRYVTDGGTWMRHYTPEKNRSLGTAFLLRIWRWILRIGKEKLIFGRMNYCRNAG